MTNADLRLLIELRFAVYQVGCEHGLWSNISENAAEEYMKIVFPKSSNLAFFNLMTNVAHKKQGENIPSDNYGLFNCPIQVEEAMTTLFKKEFADSLPTFEDPLDFIHSLATIPTDHAIASVYIGQLTNDLDSIIRLMALHYYNMFTQGYHCFPYFN